MKNVNEERIEAIRLINKVVVLKANVSHGCVSDKKELSIQMLKLADVKTWAIENNQIPELRHYFASHNFGQTCQFAASEIATYFNN
jgi:hypothetical protein